METESPLKRYLRATFVHGIGLWLGATVTIGTWLVDKAVDAGWLGNADWWLEPQPLFYVIVASMGLALAQFLAWKEAVEERSVSLKRQEDTIQELRESIQELQRKLETQSRFNRLTALTAELDPMFGPTSRLTVPDQFHEMTTYFEPLEREVLSGDFTHAVNVLALKTMIFPVLAEMFGTSTGGYHSWRKRIIKVIELVRIHEEELATRSALRPEANLPNSTAS